MNLDSNDIELIEKSIDGTLNETESIEFEKKLKNSETFRENVKFQRSLLSALEASKKVRLKEELSQMLSEVNNEKKPIPISNRWYMLAASIVIILGAMWIFDSNKPSNEELVQKYYQPYPAQGFVRGDAPQSEQNEILQLYTEEKYSQTVDRILELKKSNKSFDGQMLFLGNAYLAQSQSEEAIASFQNFELESKYYNDSQWYLALAYLENGATQEAMGILKQLSEERTVYSSSARSLLKEVE